MQEKEMVNDALNNINSGLTSYANAIAQSENQQLRSTLKQMRNQAEKSQYDLYSIAKNLNYYTPASQASEQEIMSVKSEVSGCASSSASYSNSISNNAASMNTSGSMSFQNQSQGLVNDIDEEKRKALQAPPKTNTTSFS